MSESWKTRKSVAAIVEPSAWDDARWGKQSLALRDAYRNDSLKKADEVLAFVRAEAALSAPAPQPPSQGIGREWQPIETAPRDGSPIFAGSIHHRSREVVCWHDGLPAGSLETLDDPEAPEEGWVNEGPHKDRFYANPRYFTHWQPLPEPPALLEPR